MKKVSEIGERIIGSKGFEMVDVEFVQENGSWYLRYYIDKPGGITLDDCQEVSEEISRQLDIEDPIPHSYILEVSSPGIERKLKKEEDFLKYIGSDVEIKTFEPFDGKKILTGTLVDYNDGTVVLKVDSRTINIPLEKISSAKLKFKFNFDEQERTK
ncbi:MAG: ribosome maturation factor RimP [Thermosediminibacteraceae bacterium]|nr:ribosome maturation factor RimP [Thermosediminibacteraceae bacterium]